MSILWGFFTLVPVTYCFDRPSVPGDYNVPRMQIMYRLHTWIQVVSTHFDSITNFLSTVKNSQLDGKRTDTLRVAFSICIPRRYIAQTLTRALSYVSSLYSVLSQKWISAMKISVQMWNTLERSFGLNYDTRSDKWTWKIHLISDRRNWYWSHAQTTMACYAATTL